MSVRAAVVICAYTEARWDDLVRAVGSVDAAAQSRPPDEVTVVIDHNPALLARAANELGVAVGPNEGRRGLAGARNTGVRGVRSEIVAFLDDDAVAAPDWLEHLTAPFADRSVAGVGGRVDADWGPAPPPWFPEEFGWVVGCDYRGLPEGPADIRNPIGAGMALRRDRILAAGGFHEGMGRLGSRPLGCEETELCVRIAQSHAGARFRYEPLARVVQVVPEERRTLGYFLSRCRAEGESKAGVRSLVGAADGLAVERRYLRSTLPAGIGRHLRSTLRDHDPAGVERVAAIAAGVAAAALGFTVASLRHRADTGERTTFHPHDLKESDDAVA